MPMITTKKKSGIYVTGSGWLSLIAALLFALSALCLRSGALRSTEILISATVIYVVVLASCEIVESALPPGKARRAFGIFQLLFAGLGFGACVSASIPALKSDESTSFAARIVGAPGDVLARLLHLDTFRHKFHIQMLATCLVYSLVAWATYAGFALLKHRPGNRAG
jgi:hypothetical protein